MNNEQAITRYIGSMNPHFYHHSQGDRGEKGVTMYGFLLPGVIQPLGVRKLSLCRRFGDLGIKDTIYYC
jgi:hypothetical protein